MSLTRLNNLKALSIKTGIIISSLFLLILMQACSDIKSRVWNKADAVIDGHHIVISPCRGSYTQTLSDTPTDRNHAFGCADNTITVRIKNEALTVNGKSYGTLGEKDSVEVKGDRVFINKKQAEAIAMK